MARITAPEKAPPATPTTDFGKKVKAHVVYKTKNGTTCPGVTTVLGVLAKPALIPWAYKMGREGVDYRKFTDEAAMVGTLAHGLIAEKLGGEVVQTDDFSPEQIRRATYGYNVFTKWLNDHQVVPGLVETKLISEKHLYGGTVDLVAEVDGVLTLIDVKSGSGIWPEHTYQVGAYWKLLKENGVTIKGARILRVGRTEGEGLDERILTGQDILRGWQVFEHALAIWRLKKDDDARHRVA